MIFNHDNHWHKKGFREKKGFPVKKTDFHLKNQSIIDKSLRIHCRTGSTTPLMPLTPASAD
ncbi:hypothetical protein DDI_3451 [Dickeya dianthicola RNS04.9]|nr:hypothetical protein DDI_3451 [Dickeya dianthicola RNS04.9]